MSSRNISGELILTIGGSVKKFPIICLISMYVHCCIAGKIARVINERISKNKIHYFALFQACSVTRGCKFPNIKTATTFQS